MVAKKMRHNENPVVIVVSPLVTLMEDQVKEATEMGITAMQLGVHDEVDITSGRWQLLFGSPESWLLNKKWRDMLGSDVFQANRLPLHKYLQSKKRTMLIDAPVPLLADHCNKTPAVQPRHKDSSRNYDRTPAEWHFLKPY
ncbi:unnamed protein product [Pleuronectes platessa]|uniref:Uncharacterized protein n=1 Tax=Pleuronectes platessa TaxID=8262 RepID=A0A9N7YCN5_PLEPL|nr:unnamed protein product [Pleuronectes platessa]